MRWDLLRLLPGHAWKTRKGCKTIVLDRGAVRFDYPRSWLVQPVSGSIALFDRRPPDNHSRIDVSCFRAPPIDYSDLPVADLIDRVTSRPRDNARFGPLREEIRGGIELAWRDTFLRSPVAEACFRACVARRGGVHCLITYEYLGAHAGHCDDVWSTILETLVLDQEITDPALGPRVRQTPT